MTIDKVQLKVLWREAFGDPDSWIDSFFTTAFSPERCRCITEDGQTVAALYWLDCACQGKKLAYMYAVATAKAYRGKGLCRALMADTHAHLVAKGYAGAVLVPGSDALRAMYEKMGYRTCTAVSRVCCEAGSEKTQLIPVDTAAYAALRRRLLPAGGVAQEGENLDFLASFSKLYRGEDFLLAAYVEDGIVHGVELLGNTIAAPGIVAALGCTRGQFRTPGEEAPFAMYLPLADHCPVPTYFGIAFD